MEQKKEQKVGLSVFNWIMCILGIVFFIMVIVLPPIFRVVFKRKVPEVLPPVVIVEKNITCNKEITDLEGIKMYQYNLNSVGDNLNVVAYTEIFRYNDLMQDLLTNLQNECSMANETYKNTEGLYYSCDVVEKEKVIDTRITLSTYQGEVLPFIENYQNQTLTSYQAHLTDMGFTCQEVQ